jgi:hypothetical protein
LTTTERKRLTEYIADTGTLVLKTVQSLSPEQLKFRPRHDRWSIVENIEHLSTVDDLVLSQIVEVVGTEEAAKESAWKDQDDALLERVRRRAPPLYAPEVIQPRNELEPAEIIKRFETVHSCVRTYVATTDAELRRFCFSHPVYGELDCYQWLLCMGAHCERHLSQIREVIESPDFPAVAPAKDVTLKSTTQ